MNVNQDDANGARAIEVILKPDQRKNAEDKKPTRRIFKPLMTANGALIDSDAKKANEHKS